MQCEGIPVRGLSLVVFIVAGKAPRCQYKMPSWGYPPVTFFVTDFALHAAKICNRQAGAAPEYAEKGVDPIYRLTFRGFAGRCYKNAEKNETATVCAKCLIIKEVQRRPESPVTVLDLPL